MVRTCWRKRVGGYLLFGPFFRCGLELALVLLELLQAQAIGVKESDSQF